MDRSDFVGLATLAIGIVLASFVVLGVSRLLVSYRTAQAIAAPLGLVGFALLVGLFVRATLAITGVVPIDDGG